MGPLLHLVHRCYMLAVAGSHCSGTIGTINKASRQPCVWRTVINTTCVKLNSGANIIARKRTKSDDHAK